jgi:sigma-B regulation protein RsbU (phosphoserine phosphatase)
MATTVQRELFPKVLPGIQGIDYAGTCRPARGVSGDYYDFLPLGEGKLGLLLADVSGKGMSAALLGASLHAAVRTHAPSAQTRCGDVLAKANTLLYETSTADRYATVFYGVYDPATRILTYANAGHYPPMLVREGSPIRLDSLTPPAGLLRVLPDCENSVQLVPGDWLLIFSDGIPEAANERQEDFGDQRLLDALGRLGAGTAAQACAGIVEEVRSHIREQRQPDDITLIAMKVL